MLFVGFMSVFSEIFKRFLPGFLLLTLTLKYLEVSGNRKKSLKKSTTNNLHKTFVFFNHAKKMIEKFNLEKILREFQKETGLKR